MSFFKPRKETIDFETQEDLPKYHFDVNGFLIFDDSSLGGCGIFRVMPMVMTSSVTHKETLGSITNDTMAQDYSPKKVMVEYGDRRADAVMQWVNFINNLQPEDEVDQQTHVQVILKKTNPDEWVTAQEHETDNLVGTIGRHGDKLSHAMERYQDSYIELLQSIDDALLESRGKWNGSAYAMEMYIVVSYTPSSEGWWMDGRDDDYYVKDTPSKKQLFDVEGMVERIGDIAVNRKERRAEKNEVNTANALYPIEEDRIAQVIQTRMHKIEQAMIKYASEVGDESLAFEIRRTHMMDNTALLAFWNNPLTPYRYRIWNMQTNMADVILGLRREESIATSDLSYLDSKDDYSSDAENEFLAKFAGKTADEVMLDDNNGKNQQDNDDVIEESLADAWSDIDPLLSVSTNVETSDQQQFIDRYARRTISVTRTKEARESAEHEQDVMALRDKMNDNASYDQLRLSEDVADDLREERMRERQARERQSIEQLRQLGEEVTENTHINTLDAIAKGERNSLSADDRSIINPAFSNGVDSEISDIFAQYANYNNTNDGIDGNITNDMLDASVMTSNVVDAEQDKTEAVLPATKPDAQKRNINTVNQQRQHSARNNSSRIRIGPPTGGAASQDTIGQVRRPKRIVFKENNVDAVQMRQDNIDAQSLSQDYGTIDTPKRRQRRITIPKKNQ